MTKFENGPADGVLLSLRRSPALLRVVQDTEGRWDALDLLDDKPEAGETLYVYRLASATGWCHIDFRDGRGRRVGRGEQIATYQFVEDQPDQKTMRDTASWQAWAREWVKQNQAEEPKSEEQPTTQD